jgi:hypothetical protein
MSRSTSLVPALAVLATASALLPAGAAVAQTEPMPVLGGKVSPSKGATPRKPKSATVDLSVKLPARQRTAGRVTFRLPANVRLSGKGLLACPAARIAELGEAGCPAGSRVGTILLTGTLSTGDEPPVTWTGNIYPASSTAFAIVLKGLTSVAFEAPITGRGRRVTLTMPPSVREPYDGHFTHLDALSASVGATRTTGTGKAKKTHRLATLTGCPADRTHDFAAEVGYSANDAGSAAATERLADTAACRR